MFRTVSLFIVRVVVRWLWSGRVSPTRTRATAMLLSHSEGKTRSCYCSCWAPDDGLEDARNML